MKRLVAGLCASLAVLTLAACDDGSVDQGDREHCPTKGASCAYSSTTSTTIVRGVTGTLRRGTSMKDAIPELEPWCRRLERVYRTETVPPKPHLVEHAVQLIDRLQAIIHTGDGVEKLKEHALASPEWATRALDALHRGSLCHAGVIGVGSSTAAVVVVASGGRPGHS
jgi:hypothetical protein